MAKKTSGGPANMKKFYMGLGLVAVVGVGALGFSLRGGTAVSEPIDLGDLADDQLVEMAQGMIYGDPDAPLTIMEFGDYQCPACASFALGIKPQVDLAYVETGQAKLVFHDFPLAMHPHAFIAARAVRCAGDQDQYFLYHDAVFRNQQSWSPKANPIGDLIDLAEDAGLDKGAFRSCLESDRHADVVSANQTLGERMGVTGTPTLIVYGGEGRPQRLGGFQFIDVQRAIEAMGGND